MSIYVLGISAFYHDSSAALVKDGEIIAAAQEERFTRKKFDPRFPHNAVNYCLEEAFIEVCEIDAIVYYDNPVLTLDRVIKSIISTAPKSIEQWEKAAGSILGVKVFIEDNIRNVLKTDAPILFTKHHRAHAASAFYPSPFKDAAFLTIDGVGEWETTTIGTGSDRGIKTFKTIHYPHSLGLLYSAFTYYTGFKVNSGEYKLMGLAPYGEPKYVNIIKTNLIDIKPDGSFQLNMDYFGFLETNYMTNEKFNTLFRSKPRDPEERITKKDVDIAASIQKVTEEVVLKLAKHTKETTMANNLVMAGGVALNCVANGVLLKEGLFDDIWIQPAAGDAGGALGAALLITHEYFHVSRKMNIKGRDTQKGSFLGPKFSKSEIVSYLHKESYPYHVFKNNKEQNQFIARSIAEGKVVGYFNGRMEFGPRALGARSIIGDPRSSKTQTIMNLKIKYRESFRPFAPSVIYDKCSEYFDLHKESPYMLLVTQVNKYRQCNFKLSKGKDEEMDLIEIVRQKRSDIPAITHVDFSARIQSVHPDDNNEYYGLIKEFEQQTGYGVIVNTSFNVRGEPIVCSPQDAYNCFMNTEMDILVLEECVLYKSEQPKYSQSNLKELLENDSAVIEKKIMRPSVNKELLDSFYDNKLIKIAKIMKKKKLVFFELRPNQNVESYFIASNNNELKIMELSIDGIVSHLKAMWCKEGLNELTGLLDPLFILANKIRQKDHSEDVSPFIYAMF
ncbi:MAG: carbamoyltransferase [Desulfobacteraceae bacterium Eth-SRB1]|nr:MAG: carbamoyltransferase [Desulfobacteraceae bacterium Eth-SRB1]